MRNVGASDLRGDRYYNEKNIDNTRHIMRR